MFCEKCGAILSETAKFCSSCGETVSNNNEMSLKALKCKMCGSPNIIETDEYYTCRNCGTKFPFSLRVRIEHTGVLTTRNDDFDVQMQKAETFILLGENEKAEQIYTQLLNSYPEKSIIYEKLIVILSNNFAYEIENHIISAEVGSYEGSDNWYSFGECPLFIRDCQPFFRNELNGTSDHWESDRENRKKLGKYSIFVGIGTPFISENVKSIFNGGEQNYIYISIGLAICYKK